MPLNDLAPSTFGCFYSSLIVIMLSSITYQMFLTIWLNISQYFSDQNIAPCLKNKQTKGNFNYKELLCNYNVLPINENKLHSLFVLYYFAIVIYRSIDRRLFFIGEFSLRTPGPCTTFGPRIIRKSCNFAFHGKIIFHRTKT